MVKRRLLTFLIVICLLLCPAFSTPGGAIGDVCFVSVNDVLDLTAIAYSSGNVVYVPYWIFSDYGLGISFTYFQDEGTAMLYNDEKIIFFDLDERTAFDEHNNTYSARAVLRGGVVYFPAAFVCSYFSELGLSWSYILGDGNGDVIRIKNDNAVLNDDVFMNSASSQLQTKYSAYLASKNQNQLGTSQPSLVPPGSDNGGASSNVSRITVAFIGLPDGALLDVLSRQKVNVCFYLSADDVLSDPDTVRRIVCDGHGIGALCSENIEADFEEISMLIYEAAMVKTVMFTVSDGADYSLAAQELGLSYCRYNIYARSDYGWTYCKSLIDAHVGSCTVFVPCTETSAQFTSSMLKDLGGAEYELVPLREK